MEEELRVRGYAPKTQESYLGHLRRFLSSRGQGREPPPVESARAHLLEMVEVHQHSARYVNQCHYALKFFFRHVAEGDFDLDALPKRRVGRSLPQVLSRTEVAAVLEKAETVRYRAILTLTYAAGITKSVGVHGLRHSFARRRTDDGIAGESLSRGGQTVARGNRMLLHPCSSPSSSRSSAGSTFLKGARTPWPSWPIKLWETIVPAGGLPAPASRESGQGTIGRAEGDTA